MTSDAIQIIRPKRPLAKFDVIKFEHSCRNDSTVLLTVEEIYRGTQDRYVITVNYKKADGL